MKHVHKTLSLCCLSAGGPVSAPVFLTMCHAGGQAHSCASRPLLGLPAEAASSDGDTRPVKPWALVLMAVPPVQAKKAVLVLLTAFLFCVGF